MESFDWVADSILAIATLIGVLTTSIVSVIGIRRAGRAEAAANEAKVESLAAKEESIAAKEESFKTAKAVDGKMTEMIKIVTAKVTAEATLVEKAAEESRKAAVIIAQGQTQIVDEVKKNGLRNDPATVIEAAANKAKTLLEAAAVTAANLVLSAKAEVEAERAKVK